MATAITVDPVGGQVAAGSPMAIGAGLADRSVTTVTHFVRAALTPLVSGSESSSGAGSGVDADSTPFRHQPLGLVPAPAAVANPAVTPSAATSASAAGAAPGGPTGTAAGAAAPARPTTVAAPVHPAAPAPVVAAAAPVAAPPATAAKMLVLTPTYFASDAATAQIGVNQGRIVLQTGLPVPTLNGDIMAGYGYWSYLPMGTQFMYNGHVYQIFNRVWLNVHGGTVSNSLFGGDLDLHTCTKTGSTLTWAHLVS